MPVHSLAALLNILPSQVAIEVGDERLVEMLVMAKRKRKPKFLSVDEVAARAEKPREEVMFRANTGPRRGDGRRRGLRPEQWARILTPEQYESLRLGREEQPFSSPLHNEAREGVYSCAGCGTAVFHSAFKFQTATGWPSFFNAIANGITVSRCGVRLVLSVRVRVVVVFM